jgi:5-methylcytosine-specific restriction enzyme subunit McrC
MNLHLVLREWQVATPESHPDLRGRYLASEAAKAQSRQHGQQGQIFIDDLADGLRIQARSWVGRMTLDDLTLSITPKLAGTPLLTLLRYAYRLHDLSLTGRAGYQTLVDAFQELLIAQLHAETTALLRRGLHRDYQRLPCRLASPRGRLDFTRLADNGARADARLPCIDYPRQWDIPINHSLAAGLRWAAACTQDGELRVQLRECQREFARDLETAKGQLDVHSLEQQLATLDRRQLHYRPALTLILLLRHGACASPLNPVGPTQLSGFLFDMNRFFQTLLGRFLREQLTDCELREEAALRGLFSFDPSCNPLQRRGTVPRPDFLVRPPSGAPVILDAKYRDLWERPLPRDMLYQLAIYALSQSPPSSGNHGLGQPGGHPRAIILYPTLHTASDQVISFNDVVLGTRKAQVILRPVNLHALANALNQPESTTTTRVRRSFAEHLVFG